jgi:HEAT repeat protein
MKSSKRPFRTFWMAAIVAVLLAVSVGLSLFCSCKRTLERVGLPGKTSLEDLQPEALRIIENALNNPDPAIRANAIEVVAATGQKQLIPRVQKLLGDDYVPVRFAAALAVGDTEYYLAKGAVLRLTEVADDNTKIAASYAMYKLGYKQYLDPIRRAVTSSDQTVRANAVVLLGKAGDPGVLELLYWAKDDDNSEPKVRYQAAEAIAKLGDERIVPKLWTLLVSKFVENKIIGIRAMGALGTVQAKEALITKLDDDIVEVRLAAAAQLAALGDVSGEQVVLSVFEEHLTAGLDQSGQERIMVLTALAIGRLGTPKVTGYLPKLIESDSPLVRLAAAQAVFEATALVSAKTEP